MSEESTTQLMCNKINLSETAQKSSELGTINCSQADINLPTLLSSIADIPTFVASGILFIASGTLLISCANEAFARHAIKNTEKSESNKTKLVFQNKYARRLRRWLPRYGGFLIFAYAVLFVSFVFNQLNTKGYIELSKDGTLSTFIQSENIYIISIIIFPSAVLFSSIFAFAAILMKKTIR